MTQPGTRSVCGFYLDPENGRLVRFLHEGVAGADQEGWNDFDGIRTGNPVPVRTVTIGTPHSATGPRPAPCLPRRFAERA